MSESRDRVGRIAVACIFYVILVCTVASFAGITWKQVPNSAVAFSIICALSLLATLTVYCRIEGVFGYRLWRFYRHRAEIPLLTLIRSAKTHITFLGAPSDTRDAEEGTSVLRELFRISEHIPVDVIFYGPTAMGQRFEFVYDTPRYVANGVTRTDHVSRKYDTFLMRLKEREKEFAGKSCKITFWRLDVPPSQGIYEIDGAIYLTLLGSEKAELSPSIRFPSTSCLAAYFQTYLNYIKANLATKRLFAYDVAPYRRDDELLEVVGKTDNLLVPASHDIVHRAPPDLPSRRRRANLYTHRHVYCFVVFGEPDEPYVVLQRRADDKDNPNLWDKSVGGHVWYGESYEDACARVVNKELGLALDGTHEIRFLCRSGNNYFTSVRRTAKDETIAENCHFGLYLCYLPDMDPEKAERRIKMNPRDVAELRHIRLNDLQDFVSTNRCAQDLVCLLQEFGVTGLISAQLALLS